MDSDQTNQAPAHTSQSKPILKLRKESASASTSGVSQATSAAADKAPVTQPETPSPPTTHATSSQTPSSTSQNQGQASIEQVPDPLPSEAEFRTQIPQDGITPYDLWLKYKDRIVNDEILSQYEHLIDTVTRYIQKEKVLVARIPALDAPLPTAAEVRARIPPNGIALNDLISVYWISYLSSGRRKQFMELVYRVAVHDRKRDLYFPLSAPLPSAEELRSRIPSKGIVLETLLDMYGVTYFDSERYEDFLELLNNVARYDKELDLFLPLPPPLPSVDELRSKIPLMGISLENLLNMYGVTCIDAERYDGFMELLDRVASYDKELDLYLPLPPPLPSAIELMSRIPPEGIPLDTLFAIHGITYLDRHRYRAFMKLLDRVARHDIEEDLYLPLLPSADELRSKIPPEGISVGDMFRMYTHVVVGDGADERKKAFSSLLKANSTYDKDRRLLMQLPSAQEVSQVTDLA